MILSDFLNCYCTHFEKLEIVHRECGQHKVLALSGGWRGKTTHAFTNVLWTLKVGHLEENNLCNENDSARPASLGVKHSTTFFVETTSLIFTPK